jgi:hypothetical protein
MYTTSQFNNPGQDTSPFSNNLNCKLFTNISDNLNFHQNYQMLNRTFRRKIPIKIILNDDEQVSMVSVGNNTQTTEENSIYHYQAIGNIINFTGKN